VSTSAKDSPGPGHRQYKYGFVTESRPTPVPAGLNGGSFFIRLISAKKNEPGVHARLAPQGIPPPGSP